MVLFMKMLEDEIGSILRLLKLKGRYKCIIMCSIFVHLCDFELDVKLSNWLLQWKIVQFTQGTLKLSRTSLHVLLILCWQRFFFFNWAVSIPNVLSWSLYSRDMLMYFSNISWKRDHIKKKIISDCGSREICHSRDFFNAGDDSVMLSVSSL